MPPTPTTPSVDGPPAEAPIPTLLRATALTATIGVVVALLGVALLLRPVHTPAQDCGTVAGFLLEGRTDVAVDPNQPPAGTTRAEARAHNRHPCRERVADAAKPGATLVLAGTAAALVALLVETVVRNGARHRRHRALRARHADAAAQT